MTLRYAHALFLLAVLFGHPALHARKPPPTPPPKVPPRVIPAPPAPPSDLSSNVNLLTQTALQQGVLNCVGRINQVGNFVGFGAQSGAVLMVPGGRPDERLISFSMEMPSDGAAAYIAATFAPNQINGCGAVYEAFVYWKQSCDALATTEYSGLKRIGLVKAAITILDGGTATKVFLMPAGSGCLSIKKEVVL